MDFVESIRQFNLMAGNTDDRFNVRQSALYFGLQLEEMGEKLRHLGFKVMGQQLDTLGRDMKKGAFDFVFEDRRIADLILDDDVDQLVVTIGSMIEGGKHTTYYSGIADDETLNSVTTLYRNTALRKA